jgi:TetR/AcrR family transcriptional repressor of nem operon
MDKNTLKKNQILQKTIHIMHQKGFNGTGIQEIANEAQIPKGSFYYYFKSKEDYAVQALKFFFIKIKESTFKILENKDLEPIERIKKFYEANTMNFEQNGFKTGCFIGNLTEEMADESDIIARTAEDIHQEISQAIYLCLEEDSIKKGKHSLVYNRVLADFIVNSWQGTLLRMKSSKDGKPLKDFTTVLLNILNWEE